MIPRSITKLFWDSDPKFLDPMKHRKLIISRTLNYGTLSDWKWLKDKYGKSVVVEIALLNNSANSRANIREGAKKLAEIIFS